MMRQLLWLINVVCANGGYGGIEEQPTDRCRLPIVCGQGRRAPVIVSGAASMASAGGRARF